MWVAYFGEGSGSGPGPEPAEGCQDLPERVRCEHFVDAAGEFVSVRVDAFKVFGEVADDFSLGCFGGECHCLGFDRCEDFLGDACGDTR